MVSVHVALDVFEVAEQCIMVALKFWKTVIVVVSEPLGVMGFTTTVRLFIVQVAGAAIDIVSTLGGAPVMISLNPMGGR